MSGKVKMRCARCGKTYKATGHTQTLCPECAAQARAARGTAKQPGAQAATPVAAPALPPKIVGPAARILAAGAVSSSVVPPPDTGLFGAAARAAERHHGEQRMEPPHPAGATNIHPVPPAQQAGVASQPPRVVAAAERQPKPPAQRAPREPRQAPPPFIVTDELRARIEARYLDLAQPVEFDGIRTRIAAELQVPKGAVKRTVATLRAQMQLPSWWELQAYHGSDDDLARIRQLYVPLLPVPPVNIHRQIAQAVGLEPTMVYQGIRRIRAEMRLPQYNPPEAHAGESPVPGPSTVPAVSSEGASAP